jgi:hypothetical protein
MKRTRSYTYRNDMAGHYLEEGRLQATRGLLLGIAEDRMGQVGLQVRARIDHCADRGLLARLVIEVARHEVPAEVELLLEGQLPR